MWIQFMQQIHGVVPSGKEDKILGAEDVNGIYAVKNYCHTVEKKLCAKEPMVLTPQASKIIPPKVIQFLWQAMRDKVAVMASLRRRGVEVDGEGVCVLCGMEEETVQHLFLHCAFTVVLWNRVIAREGNSWCVPGTLIELLQQWESLRLVTDSELWPLVPYAVLWSVWMARNDVIFRAKQTRVAEVWDDHVTRIYCWIRASGWECAYALYDFTQNFEHVRLVRRPKLQRFVEWQPPLEGVFKFNVDGAARGSPGIAGAGGILRDWNGEVKGYFSLSLGVAYAYEAEIKAILYALKFCKEFGFLNIVIESDSTLAIGWVKNGENRPWKHLNDFHTIDFLRVDVNCVDIVHVYREGNDKADDLAKEGCDRAVPLWVMF